jgi:hypothetical protein
MIVPSLNRPGGWHMIFWDGNRVWDPSPKMVYAAWQELSTARWLCSGRPRMAPTKRRKKGLYIGAPACFALEEAIRPICEAFGAYRSESRLAVTSLGRRSSAPIGATSTFASSWMMASSPSCSRTPVSIGSMTRAGLC